jgi:hypothetical protein
MTVPLWTLVFYARYTAAGVFIVPSRYTKWDADEDPSVSSNPSLVTLLEHTHSICPLRDPLLDHRPCRRRRPTYASEARAEGHGRR